MSAWYNENDPSAAAWLRALIAENLIAPGDVDERDIRDVKPYELRAYTQCHFFAGIGGWSLALRRAAWPDRRPVWTGSCPCQPFSAAGKRGGFADERHLWPAFHWLVSQCRPPTVFGEQVASATDWLRLVRGDLEALEYAVGAMPIEAASAGADHLRDRFWFVADRKSEQVGTAGQPRERGDVVNCESIAEREQDDEGNALPIGGQARPISGGAGDHIDLADRKSEQVGTAGQSRQRGDVVDANQPGSQRPIVLPERADQCAAGSSGLADADELGQSEGRQQRSGEQRGTGSDPEACDWVIGADGKARRVKSGVRLLANGFPCRVGLLRGFGNAIDPRPPAAFIEAYLTAGT